MAAAGWVHANALCLSHLEEHVTPQCKCQFLCFCATSAETCGIDVQICSKPQERGEGVVDATTSRTPNDPVPSWEQIQYWLLSMPQASLVHIDRWQLRVVLPCLAVLQPDQSRVHPWALSQQPLKCERPVSTGMLLQVGSTALRQALDRLKEHASNDSNMQAALADLDTSDDAALIPAPPAGQALVQSIDFFKAIINDPYLFGAIAANHALSV